MTPNLCLWDESISAYVQLLVDGIVDFSLFLIFAYSVLDSDGQLIEAAGRQSKGLSVPLLVCTRGTRTADTARILTYECPRWWRRIAGNGLVFVHLPFSSCFSRSRWRANVAYNMLKVKIRME